jgi:AcrR family transcriptional regulator
MVSTTPSGRPRDPDVDRRVADAAIAVYGEVGWAGFSVEAVARRAGVGKASIYLRWPSKEALLVDAIRARFAPVTDVDTGTARGDLLHLARQLLGLYLGGTGRAALRAGIEARGIRGLAEPYGQLIETHTLAARAIARRAIRRGELPASTSVTLLLDTLAGGVMAHAMATPEHLRAKVLAQTDSYAEQLVDFILSAVMARR